MSINYPVLFQSVGRIVKASNGYIPIAATQLPTDQNSIIAQYGTAQGATAPANAPIATLPSAYSAFQSQVVGWRVKMQSFIDATFLSLDNVLSQLSPQPQANLQFVLPAILADMVANGQTVQRCTVTVGAVSPGAANVGTATCLVDKVLDGFTSPVKGGIVNPLYAGVNSELAVTETQTLVCTSDSSTGGSQEGSETWSWAGGTNFGKFAWQGEGSGSGTNGQTIQTANGDTTILQNLGFTSFSNNTPTSWTVDSGVAGTNIFQESITIFRAGSALRFSGDGATATLQVGQPVVTNSIKSRQRYAVTFMVYRSGAAPGLGSLNIKFTGTGYAAAGSEQINVLFSSIPINQWTLYNFYVTAPVNPTAFRLQIQANGTLASGASVILDSGTCTYNRYFGGVSVLPVAGMVPASVGDVLRFSLTNDSLGVWNTFARKAYGIQFPSVGVGPTVLDSWAS